MMRRRKTALLLCAVMTAAVLLLLLAPLYSFTVTVYSKKSANTFPGDEKYQAVLAEAEETAAVYEASGRHVTLNETQTLRETSKGQTSLMAFTLSEITARSGWQILSSGLKPAVPLLILVICAALSAVLTLAGSAGAPDPRQRTGVRKALCRAGCACALAALLLVPVVAMNCNYHFNRAVRLFSEGTDVAGVEALLPRWDAFLYRGAAGDGIASSLAGMKASLSPLLWALLPLLFVLLAAEIYLSEGKVKHVLARGALYLFVVLMCIFILYPFFVMVITGFRSPSEATDMKFLYVFPTRWIWSNLSDIVGRGVLRFMGNSIALSVGATAIAMVCGIPAAYAMSRMRFRGRKAFLGFVIMSQMFSPVVLLVGISKLMNALQLNNSIIGLMFINAAFNQAFAIWLLRGVFVSISPEMEQAACIDGCSTVGALLRILLPMAAPGVVTSLIFVFINSWNEYTISTVLITNRLNKPITVGITEFSSYNMVEWNYLFAAAFLATIPVVILFICIEKHLVSGLTAGGVKG